MKAFNKEGKQIKIENKSNMVNEIFWNNPKVEYVKCKVGPFNTTIFERNQFKTKEETKN